MANFDANTSVNITELKKNPMAVLKRSKGKPVAILNRDKHVAYLVPAKTYEKILDILEDYELAEIVRKRKNR